jgi:16S rRNA processing protein RimM
VIATLSGIGDRDAAEALKGVNLFAPRDALPPAGEDEFYHADLVGLRAEAEDGTDMGTVRALHDFGAGDVIEIQGPDGAPFVLPFTRAAVPVIDIAGGRIVVAPPPGLLGPMTEEEKRQ